MQNIEQQALQTHQENLAYFEKNHPDVYKKLIALEAAIQSEQLQEKYALEYKDEGYFDVQELASGEWLYGQNSIAYSEHIAQMTDHKRTGGIFRAQKYVDFSPEMPDIVDKSELSFHNALWATIKVIEYHKKKIDAQVPMNSVFKTIFIGTGLGVHISKVINKLNSKIVYIHEQNLELFHLSLFVTSYQALSKGKFIFFSIMDSQEEERKNFTDFLENGNNHNLYIKHIPFIKNYEKVLQTFQTHVLSQSFIMYGYSALLLRAIDAPKHIVQNRAFLNLGNFYNDSPLANKPILFVFSGPSTGKNIKWLHENKDRFILVAPLSACRLLHKFNIIPDFVVHIDPGAKETAALFEGLDTEYFDKSIIILASNVDDDTVKRFKANRVFFVEQGTEYKVGFPNLSAPSVGEYSYALFLVFGVQNLFMLGLDLALDPETLSTHSEHHPFTETGKKELGSASLDYKTAIEYTRGNFLDVVPTLALYKISIQEFNRFTVMLKKPYQKIHNLGNGAYLQDTIPLKVESVHVNEFKILNKTKETAEIVNFLNQISSNEFRNEDKKTIEYQIKQAKKLLFIIQQHKKLKHKNTSAYLDSLANLSYQLGDMENKTKSYLAEVYYEYFKIVLSYIFDLFNTSENQNNIQLCKEIDSILVNQLLKIGNLFVDRLEDYLQ